MQEFDRAVKETPLRSMIVACSLERRADGGRTGCFMASQDFKRIVLSQAVWSRELSSLSRSKHHGREADQTFRSLRERWRPLGGVVCRERIVCHRVSRDRVDTHVL